MTPQTFAKPTLGQSVENPVTTTFCGNVTPTHYKQKTALSDIHHLTCGISSLLHFVNLILFTVLLVHLIVYASPHHSHLLDSHHLSLPQSFTPDLKLISFTHKSFLP